MTAEPSDREGVALPFQRRAIVINERPSQDREQRPISQAPLDDSLVEGHASDMPLFPSFDDVELEKTVGTEPFILKFPKRSVYIQGCFCDIPLDRSFPAHASPGKANAFPKMAITHRAVKAIRFSTALLFFPLSCGPSAAVSHFSPFFACDSSRLRTYHPALRMPLVQVEPGT